MQTKLVDVSDEIKVLVIKNDNRCSVDICYAGSYGKTSIIFDHTRCQSLPEALALAQHISRNPLEMEALRDNHEIVRLFHILVAEQGLHTTIREFGSLETTVRVTQDGKSSPAAPEGPLFAYDNITTPLHQLRYERVGSRLHFQLNSDGDEVAFFHKTPAGSRWRHHADPSPRIRHFAVKKLFEIYKADQSRKHLAWVSDLHLSKDLGL